MWERVCSEAMSIRMIGSAAHDLVGHSASVRSCDTVFVFEVLDIYSPREVGVDRGRQG